MRRVTFYHAQTGRLNGLSVIASDDQAIALNTPADHIAIDHPQERQLDHLCEQVDLATGKVVDYQPPQPNADHDWDPSTKRWKLNAVVAAKQAQSANALAQIRSLEGAQGRPLRELARDPMNAQARARIDAIDEEIAKLRSALAS